MVKKGPESRRALLLLNALRKAKLPVWKRIAELLRRPRRKRVEVSLGRLNRLAKEGEKVVVPGKIIASGRTTHSLTVGYFSASRRALEQLAQSGAQAMPLEKFLSQYSQAKGIKIVI